ncbi:MAG: iron-containing alcohol dehydrogenase [Intestinimonas sp.]
MTHKLEHELGGLYDVAHGAGLAAVWGSWARHVYRSCPERFARFAVHVLGLPPGRMPEETALRGIGAMEDFYRGWACPPASGSWGWRPPRRSWPCWPASARRPAAGAAVPSAAWRAGSGRHLPHGAVRTVENKRARLLKKPAPSIC